MNSRVPLKRLVNWCKWMAVVVMTLPCAACAFEGGAYPSTYGYQTYQTYPTPGYQGYQTYSGYSSIDVTPVPIITPEPIRVFGGRYGRGRNIRREVNRGRQSIHEFHGHQGQRGPDGGHGGQRAGGFHGGHPGGGPQRGQPGRRGGPNQRH